LTERSSHVTAKATITVVAFAMSNVACLDLIDASGYYLLPPMTNRCTEVEVPTLGGCQVVGVLECGDGFYNDGRGGCRHDTADACEPGQMAWLGDDSCLPVGTNPCGDADPQNRDRSVAFWVWQGSTATDPDGSQEAPFITIADALAVVQAGGHVMVSHGVYEEDLVVDREDVTLQGVCPDEVEVRGTELDSATVSVVANGVTLRSLHISGAGVGVGIDAADDVTLSELWVHAPEGRGIDVRSGEPPNSDSVDVGIERTLIEDAWGSGIHAAGALLTMTRVEVRDTRDRLSRLELGQGLVLVPGPYLQTDDLHSGATTEATLVQVLLRRNHSAAVFLRGSGVLIENSLISDTLPSEGAAELGLPTAAYGIDIEADVTRGVTHDGSAAGALGGGAAFMSRSIIEGSVSAGLRVNRASVALSNVVVRDTRAGPGTCAGHGIRAVGDSGAPSNVYVFSSLIDGSQQSAIQALGATLWLQYSIVRDTYASPCGFMFGDGVALLAQPRNAARYQPTSQIITSRIASSRRYAISLFDAHVVVTQALLVDAPVVLSPYPTDDSDDLGGALLAQNAVKCEIDGLLEVCHPIVGLVEPPIFARDESGVRVPTVLVSGTLRDAPSNDADPLEGATVRMLGRDDVPSTRAEEGGVFELPLPAQTLLTLMSHHPDYTPHTLQLTTPAEDIVVEPSLLPLSASADELRDLLGSPWDFSSAYIVVEGGNASIPGQSVPGTNLIADVQPGIIEVDEPSCTGRTLAFPGSSSLLTCTP
jgi:hypothetical protein